LLLLQLLLLPFCVLRFPAPHRSIRKIGSDANQAPLLSLSVQHCLTLRGKDM
jgi:hypothetical protein